MNAPETVTTLFARIDSGDVTGAARLLAPGFEHVSSLSGVIGADRWLAALQLIGAAFPDLTHGITDLTGDTTVAAGVFHVAGTHTGRLLLPQRDIDIPATGRRVHLPPEPFQARVAADGRIERIRVEHSPRSGLPEILRQLGACDSQGPRASSGDIHGAGG